MSWLDLVCISYRELITIHEQTKTIGILSNYQYNGFTFNFSQLKHAVTENLEWIDRILKTIWMMHVFSLLFFLIFTSSSSAAMVVRVVWKKNPPSLNRFNPPNKTRACGFYWVFAHFQSFLAKNMKILETFHQNIPWFYPILFRNWIRTHTITTYRAYFNHFRT